MAASTYTGAGNVSAADVRYVKWEGKTKGGQAVTIELEKAFCRSNPDWTFEEKNDVTPEVEFEGMYSDDKLASGDRTEPWKLTVSDGVTAGNGEILLGVGRFYVGTSKDDAKAVGLTRGGGSFIVEREYREINADDDPGLVEGRVEKTSGRPKLKLTALQWLTKVSDLYACITPVTA
jgi:hypothetical protein